MAGSARGSGAWMPFLGGAATGAAHARHCCRCEVHSCDGSPPTCPQGWSGSSRAACWALAWWPGAPSCPRRSPGLPLRPPPGAARRAAPPQSRRTSPLPRCAAAPPPQSAAWRCPATAALVTPGWVHRGSVRHCGGGRMRREKCLASLSPAVACHSLRKITNLYRRGGGRPYYCLQLWCHHNLPHNVPPALRYSPGNTSRSLPIAMGI